MFRSSPCFAAFLILLAAARPGASQTVTYSEHIAPILYNNCIKCHRPNQVAPFSLLTYDDAARHGRDMVMQTQSRYMPPWKPEPGWAAYRDERRLTADQIALIQQWVDGGMPQGDPAKAPLAAAVHRWLAARHAGPDSGNAAAFTVPADGPDIYRNFVIPSGLTEDKWVTRRSRSGPRRAAWCTTCCFSPTPPAARAADGKDGQPGISGLRHHLHHRGSAGRAQRRSGRLGSGDHAGISAGGHRHALPEGRGFADADPLPSEWHSAEREDRDRAVLRTQARRATMTQLQVPAFFGAAPTSISRPARPITRCAVRTRCPPMWTQSASAAHAHYLAQGGQADRDPAFRRSPHSAVDPPVGFQLAGPIYLPGPGAAAQRHATRWRIDLRQLQQQLRESEYSAQARCDGARTPPTKWAACC